MLFSLGRHRRNLGRSARARLHRDPPACRCFGAERDALLASAARRHREPQRSADAVADRKCAVAAQRSRPKSTGTTRMGYSAVPRPGDAAGAVDCHT